MLPDADRAVLRAEADYGFLLLLSQYDPAAGVPFAGYIKTKLLFHMFNWCRSEQKRIWGEAAWEDETFDEKISAAWMNRNAFLGGGVGEWASGCVGKWRSCQSVKNR